MQFFILSLFVCVTLFDFVILAFHLPGALRFISEIFSVIAAAYVLFAGTRHGFRLIAPRYWIAFGALAFTVICGIASNSVGSGPTLGGIRFYLHAIPFFFLPAIFRFDSEQLEKQLRFLVVLALIQLPIACYQRWIVWSEGRFSGDQVSGTLLTSGILSIFLISAVLVLTGFFLQKRIARMKFILLFFLLLIPTTINETKATVLMLPLGLLAVLVTGAPKGRRLVVVGWAAALLTAFGAIFVPVYDLMQTHNPYKKDLIEFFTDDKQLDSYMAAKNAGIGTTDQVGRADAIKIPLAYLARDPITLAFGLGIGNASHSSLGENFTGKYYGLFQSFVITSFTVFLLELGILGTVLVFVIYWFITRDVMFLARSDDSFLGSMAAGWTGVMLIITLSTFYTTIHVFDSLSYLFWYLSGILAARRTQLALET